MRNERGVIASLVWLLAAGCGGEAYQAVPLPPRQAAADAPPEPAAAAALLESVVRKGGLTLPDCIASAEANSELLGRLWAEIDAARARGDLARSATLPQVIASYQHFRQEKAVGTSGLSVRKKDEDWITVRQAVFSGLRDLHVGRQMDALVAASRFDREQALLEVRLAVCEAYARVLSAESQVQAIGSSHALARSRLEELEARRGAGLARATEVLLAEAQVARNEAERSRAMGELADARAALRFMTGIPHDLPLSPFPAFPASLLDPLRLSEEAAPRRRDLAALERQERAARDALRAERSAWWPTVDAVGNWYERREGLNKDVEWDASIQAQWPIWQGGKVDAQVRQAEARHRQAELAMRERRRGLRRESEEAVSAYQTARATLVSLEKEAKAAEETARLLSEEFRQGIATHLELLTAQDTLLAARVGLVRQELAVRLASLGLWRVLGEFPALEAGKEEGR